MKIARKQLKQIIREELSRVLREDEETTSPPLKPRSFSVRYGSMEGTVSLHAGGDITDDELKKVGEAVLAGTLGVKGLKDVSVKIGYSRTRKRRVSIIPNPSSAKVRDTLIKKAVKDLNLMPTMARSIHVSIDSQY